MEHAGVEIPHIGADHVRRGWRGRTEHGDEGRQTTKRKANGITGNHGYSPSNTAVREMAR